MKVAAYLLPPGLLSQLAGANPYRPPPTLSPASYQRGGAVASESDICSEIGGDVLKKGGNAADSLVATTLCVGVVGMYHSGIGGGGFMLVRSPNGSYEFIDFRETAPAAAFEDMYKNNTNSSIYGGLASGVPGELRGLDYLHKNYGKLPWRDVVLPAVHVARDGWMVRDDLVRYMDLAVQGIPNFIVDDPNWAMDFAPNGTRLGVGDIITRKRYAKTLATIAEHGVDAFYSGPIAETFIKSIQSQNGTMTRQDLANYTVITRKTESVDYRGYKIHSGGAPSSGTVALSVMRIIEGYTDIGWPPTINISTHYFDEALRFAYGQRSELGDPLFVKGLDEYQADMLSDETTEAIRAKISPLHTLNVSAYDPSGFESLDTPGTSAVVSSDANGLAIALTTTINLLFGSHVLVPETGIIANNEMNDFSIPDSSNAFGYIPSPSNYVRPGKRPLSSITPVIVERPDGSLYFVTAAAGGSRITTAVLQQLWHVLDQNMTAAAALAAPRLHDQLVPNVVRLDWTYDNATAAFLRSRGHNVTYVNPVGTSAAASVRVLENGTFEAAGEPRLKDSGGVVVVM